MSESIEGSPYLAAKTMMMPGDENPHGTVFAGAILSQMVLAGILGAGHSICGRGWPKPLLVARGMEQVEFHRPALVGDVVSFLTRELRLGNTSITVKITAEANRDGASVLLAEAQATYVAVEGDGEPRRPVPIRGN